MLLVARVDLSRCASWESVSTPFAVGRSAASTAATSASVTRPKKCRIDAGLLREHSRTDAQFRLAEIQFFKNNFDSALALLAPLTENLKADESNDALILQYFVIENRVQFPEALKQYSHAELLARQYKLSEAIQELSSIIDIYPTAPLADDVLLKKAEYSIQLKRYAEALALYQKLLVDYKESIEKDKTQFKIGELYQLYLMDKQKAIDAYEVILEKYPFSLFIEQARKRIRQIRGDSI